MHLVHVTGILELFIDLYCTCIKYKQYFSYFKKSATDDSKAICAHQNLC